MEPKHKVIIRRCDEYDPAVIGGIIKEGMEELNAVPTGKVLLKPNVVIAHPDLFPHAFTRKEFLDGAIWASKERSEGLKEIAVGERCGITLPTRWVFQNAGYPEILKKHKIKAYYFDEAKQVPVTLKKSHALRKTMFLPKPVTETDFLINLPKFKAHPWCRLTLSLKNYIGIQDDRHRLVDHNIFLEHKIADLQEAIQPKFIAIDAITAGQKMMLSPTPFHMGAIVMGTNSCAVDTVGCHMVHVDPESLTHLKYASDRGFGPMDLDAIDVAGDFPLEEIRAKTKNFEFCMAHIDDYFEQGTNLTCTVGRFPEKHSPDYCWGGCPGALQEAMHLFNAMHPDATRKMKKVHYVVGKVDGPIPFEKDEKILFAGNCTAWQGEINGQDVVINSSYRSPQSVDEKKTPSNDMLLKTAKTLWSCLKQRKSDYVHAKGCPVSVGDHVHFLSMIGKLRNLNFDRRVLLPMNIAYWKMRFFRALNRISTN